MPLQLLLTFLCLELRSCQGGGAVLCCILSPSRAVYRCWFGGARSHSIGWAELYSSVVRSRLPILQVGLKIPALPPGNVGDSARIFGAARS